MKTLTYPDRIELISESGVLGFLKLAVAGRALIRNRRDALVSLTLGEGMACVIVRDAPKVGKTIQLTAGEIVLHLKPKCGEGLTLNVEHTPECLPRVHKGAWTRCRCAPTVTIRRIEDLPR